MSNFTFATPAAWPEALDKLPTLKKRTMDDGLRLYKNPYKDVEYPSVTTVLSDYDKEGIIQWRERVGEREANIISERASIRGNGYHSILEDYILGKSYYKENRSEEILKLFNALKNILDANINNIHCVEQALYSDFLQVAGTVDLIAEWQGKLSVVDFKTSLRTKKKEWIKNYFMQKAAYAVMYEDMTGIPVSQLVTFIACHDMLNLYDNGIKIQTFIEHRNDHIQDFIVEKDRWFQNLGSTK